MKIRYLHLLISFCSLFFFPNFTFPFTANEPIIAGSFFFWYNSETGEHLWNNSPKDYIITYKPHIVLPNGQIPGVSYKSKQWFRNEIEDMTAAGINVITPLIWTNENSSSWNAEGMKNLLDTMLEMEKDGLTVPKIAPFFDTSSIQFDQFAKIERETGKPVNTADPAAPWVVDLTKEENMRLFYNHIKKCYILMTGNTPDKFNSETFDPKECKYYHLWAMQDGFPMVFIWEAGKGFFYKDWNAELFEFIISEFEKDFKMKPRLFPDYEWSLKSKLDDETPFNLNGGGYIRWRASVYEPYAMNEKIQLPLKGADGIEFGPGYDDRHFPGRLTNGTPVRSRDNGYFFCYGWQYALRTGKKLAMIESWNELHEGTQINESFELGRKYINLNREYVKKFVFDYSKLNTLRCKMAGFNNENMAIINEEEGLYQIDGGVLRSTEQPYNAKETDYIFDPPPPTNGKTKPYFKDDRFFRKTDLPQHRFMYFDIDDRWTSGLSPESDIFVHIRYLDKNKDKFTVLYNQGDIPLTANIMEKSGSEKIKWTTFKLEKPNLKNPHGIQQNYYNYIKQGCDFLIDSAEDGDDYISEVVVSKSPKIIHVKYDKETYPGTDTELKIFMLNNGYTDKKFEGSVLLSCSDSAALPDQKIDFTSKDQGEKTIRVRFRKAGEFNLNFRDYNNPECTSENLRILVQRFRIEIQSRPQRDKKLSFKVICLDDNGEVNKKYNKKIIFSKQNMDDIFPLFYTFTNKDCGEKNFSCVIMSYGIYPVIVEEKSDSAQKGISYLQIPAPDCSVRPEKENNTEGLIMINPGDGDCTAECTENEIFRKIKNTPESTALYFNIDDRLYYDLPAFNDKYIKVKYFDDNGEFFLEYDSNDEYTDPPGFKKTRTQTIKRTGSNKWKTAIFYLEDAKFMNRTNGADFRIVAPGSQLKVSNVELLPQLNGKLTIEKFSSKNHKELIFWICMGVLIIIIFIITLYLDYVIGKGKDKGQG